MNSLPGAVVETYIELRKSLTELRLHELTLCEEGVIEGVDCSGNPSKKIRSGYDIEIYRFGAFVADVSLEGVEKWIDPSGEYFDVLSSDELWQTLKDDVLTSAREHEDAVEELSAVNDGVQKDMIEAIRVVSSDWEKEELANMQLSRIDWDLAPFDEPIRENPEEGKLKWGLQSVDVSRYRMAVAEMVRGTKQYTKNVLAGRGELTQKVRDDVSERDGGCCVHCASKTDLTHHHIIPVSMGGEGGSMENLAVLCHDCHCDVHGGGGNWTETVYDSKEGFWEWVEKDEKCLGDYHVDSISEAEREVPVAHADLFRLDDDLVSELEELGVETVGELSDTSIEVIESLSLSSRQFEKWKHDNVPR